MITGIQGSIDELNVHVLKKSVINQIQILVCSREYKKNINYNFYGDGSHCLSLMWRSEIIILSLFEFDSILFGFICVSMCLPFSRHTLSYTNIFQIHVHNTSMKIVSVSAV